MLRLLAFVLAISTTVRAVNTIEREFTCPIDGHQFKQRIETSAQPSDVRLDLRRLGDVVDPPTVPQCPKCKFVLFTDTWPEPLVDQLKPFILGQDYQLIAAKSPSYFCLAQIQRHLRAPALYGAHSYLRASWQAEESEGMRERCLARAHENFTAALTVIKPGDKEFADTVLLCGELERRLQKWDIARERFGKLRADPAFTTPARRSVIDLQLALIDARDSDPHSASKPLAKPQSTIPTETPAEEPKPSSPAPESLKEASAGIQLPPVAEGPGDIHANLPKLPALPRSTKDPEMLPEPRVLASSATRKSAPKKRTSAKHLPAAKPAIIATPERRKSGSAKLIGAN